MEKKKKRKRRKWTLEKKLKIYKTREEQGLTVKRVCRKFDISFSQYYKWRKQLIGLKMLKIKK